MKIITKRYIGLLLAMAVAPLLHADGDLIPMEFVVLLGVFMILLLVVFILCVRNLIWVYKQNMGKATSPFGKDTGRNIFMWVVGVVSFFSFLFSLFPIMCFVIFCVCAVYFILYYKTKKQITDQ